MSISVGIREFKNVLSTVAELKQKDVNVPILLRGMHGLGKTETVLQWAKENDYNCVTLSLSTQDVADLIGLPSETLDETNNTKFTTWDCPEWLYNAKNDPRPCVFFLDEMNRANPMVLQTMLPFVLQGTLHVHTIRPADFVVAAINPDMADYNVTELDDRALLSRFAHFYFEPEVSEWTSYCAETKVHPAIVEVVNTSPGTILRDEIIPDVNRYDAKPDRRMLHKIGRILNIMEPSDVSSIGFKLFSAMIGQDVTGLIITTYNETKNPTLDDVFSGKVMEMIDFVHDLDKINIVNELLINFIVNPKSKTVLLNRIKKYKKNIHNYISAEPKDVRFSFLRTLKYKFADDSSKNKFHTLGNLVEIIDAFDPDMINELTEVIKEKTEEKN